MPSARSSPRRSISPSVYMSMMSPTPKPAWPWVYCGKSWLLGRHRAGPPAGGGISTVPVLARRIRIGGGAGGGGGGQGAVRAVGASPPVGHLPLGRHPGERARFPHKHGRLG